MGETPDSKSAEFKLGDLVWAKLKGFCPWPGKVVAPPINITKPKKGVHECVLFFGSNNYAYIELHNLKPYLEYKGQLIGACKTAPFKEAVAAIEEYIGKREKFGIDFDANENDPDTEFDRLREDSPSSTPKDKAKKDKPKKESVGKKRSAESIGRPPKKSRISTQIDDADETPRASANHVGGPRRGLTEILNRPSMLTRPETPPTDLTMIPASITEKNVEPSKLNFGFIGLGNFGTHIVRNLANSGHKIVVWNRTPDKTRNMESIGVKVMQTPCDVIQNADITFGCVADPAAAKNIVFGNCGVLQADLTKKAYVEMTGIDNETSQDICDAITGAGGRYMEAQLLGNRAQAEQGTLLIMAAGDQTLFKDCHSCFRVMGRHSYHLKDVGNACKMSLVFNLMTGITVAALAEAMALADRAGLEQRDVHTILQHTRLACPEMLENCEKIVNSPYIKHFPLKHMQKYLKLALNMADPLEQSLPLTATTNEVYKHTKRLGYSDFDISRVSFAYNEHKLLPPKMTPETEDYERVADTGSTMLVDPHASDDITNSVDSDEKSQLLEELDTKSMKSETKTISVNDIQNSTAL